ncbi:MAG TPA: NADP-dependent oxidoreductase [Candidatus Brocadiales bacterium]|nr:NADP-dependent oxidoreductase [Candidatus Brocadiales bacterium]
MKAIQINKYGGNEVVEINKNVQRPSVAKGKILVEVRAAGVNPVDWKIREGHFQQMAPLKFPATLGGDFSGLVLEVGEGISGFIRGDEVYGSAIILGGGSGSFAEFALANAKAVANKPGTVNHIEAAALPLAGVSALQALLDHINLKKGQKILIHGGAGGIGTFAIQVARHLGAYTATTVSKNDFQHAKELGADEVIDYKDQAFEEILKDFDAVFDTVGGQTYERSFRVIKKGGIIVSMLEQPNKALMDQYGVNAIGQFTQITSDRLSKLAELVDKVVIRSHVDKTFQLDQAGEALHYLQTGHPRGKVVVEVRL